MRVKVSAPKFGDRFTGPYTVVVKILNPASLWIRDEVTNHEFSVNVDKCKRYFPRQVEDQFLQDFDIVIAETDPAVPVHRPRPRVDSNPSRRPIDRDPYNLRPRAGSRTTTA
jgi:hypothetical protein